MTDQLADLDGLRTTLQAVVRQEKTPGLQYAVVDRSTVLYRTLDLGQFSLGLLERLLPACKLLELAFRWPAGLLLPLGPRPRTYPC